MPIDLSEQEITKRLKNAPLEPPSTDEDGYSTFLQGDPTAAAVLMPLLWKGGEWHLLLTRRNSALPEHSGQVAFPGGRADEGDANPEVTALREACEEIGLKPEDVRILGRLRTFHTISHYLVTPIVGVVPWPYTFRPASDEVSRIFTIPLDWLAEPTNHEIMERELPAPHAPVSVIYFKPYDGEVLWGVSARFTISFLKVIFWDRVEGI